MSVGLNLNTFSQINSLVSSLVKQLAPAQLQQAAQVFGSITDGFSQGTASGGGAAAGNLAAPTGDVAARISGSGANGPARPAGVSAALWDSALASASGAGATGGTGAVSGGAGGAPVTGGGSNLADAAKAQNWQYLDDRQKANLALQEAAQKQSEAAALITTLMKMLHDTLTQIIQNMK